MGKYTMDGKGFVYDFDEDCSWLLGQGQSADDIRVIRCPECKQMTTVLGEICGYCGAGFDPEGEGVMTLADYLQQQLDGVLWSGGEA